MFAERPPFMVDSLQKLYKCHLSLMPDNPSDINPKCPQDLAQIILKLLAKTPDKRFKDFFEFRAMLHNIGKSRI